MTNLSHQELFAIAMLNMGALSRITDTRAEYQVRQDLHFVLPVIDPFSNQSATPVHVGYRLLDIIDDEERGTSRRCARRGKLLAVSARRVTKSGTATSGLSAAIPTAATMSA